jgi:hypothetical protein
MGEYFWGFFLIIFGVLSSFPYLITKIIEGKNNCQSLTVEDLTIPKKKFVELVLLWCHQNLGHRQHNTNLQIYYYYNNKWGGLYNYRNRQITLYIPRSLTLDDLTNNVIHEYVHYLQIVNPSDDSMYNKHNQEVGCWDNPYEVEARKLAEKHQKQCLEWVLRNLSS